MGSDSMSKMEAHTFTSRRRIGFAGSSLAKDLNVAGGVTFTFDSKCMNTQLWALAFNFSAAVAPTITYYGDAGFVIKVETLANSQYTLSETMRDWPITKYGVLKFNISQVNATVTVIAALDE